MNIKSERVSLSSWWLLSKWRSFFLYGTSDSLLFHKSATGPYVEPIQSNSDSHNFISVKYILILSSCLCLGLIQNVFSLQIFQPTFCIHLVSPMCVACLHPSWGNVILNAELFKKKNKACFVIFPCYSEYWQISIYPATLTIPLPYLQILRKNGFYYLIRWNSYVQFSFTNLTFFHLFIVAHFRSTECL